MVIISGVPIFRIFTVVKIFKYAYHDLYDTKIFRVDLSISMPNEGYRSDK